MPIVIYLPLLICLLGLVLFLTIQDPDRKAVAKDMFWIGLLVFLINRR
jgi:hypothetical protein